jgi:ABC-2 type transport system permease protein
VIGVTFGNNLPYVMLLCVLGSFTGISFGAFIAIILRKSSEGMKVAVTSITGVLGGFLSGMMNANVKYFIDTEFPIVSRINPVNVMTDGLFSLYYFPTKERYFTNIMILGIMIVVFVTVTYINFRRDDYESL